MLSDQVVSLIRTWVPVGVGAALTWLATKTGVVVSEEASTGLTVALVSGVYYGIVRLAAERWPWFGVLLGSRKHPTYDKPVWPTSWKTAWKGWSLGPSRRSVPGPRPPPMGAMPHQTARGKPSGAGQGDKHGRGTHDERVSRCLVTSGTGHTSRPSGATLMTDGRQPTGAPALRLHPPSRNARDFR